MRTAAHKKPPACEREAAGRARGLSLGGVKDNCSVKYRQKQARYLFHVHTSHKMLNQSYHNRQIQAMFKTTEKAAPKGGRVEKGGTTMQQKPSHGNEVMEIEAEMRKAIEGRVFVKKSRLAKILDISPNSLNDLLIMENIPFYRHGRDSRIRVSDAARLMQAGKTFSPR